MLSEATARFFRSIGGYYRKPISWGEVGMPIPPAKLAELEVFTSAELGIEHNIASTFLPQGMQYMILPTIFVVSHKGGLYLVNTEGAYNIRYIRYVGTTQQGPGYNDAEAKQEGWALFECDDGYYRIQKLDNLNPDEFLREQEHREKWPNACPRFVSDYAALTHVIQRANAGSMMHKIALGLHGTSVDRKFTHPADDGLRGYGERGA